MPRHISIVFPGQGSQTLGMLDSLPSDLINKYKDDVIEALNFDLIDLITNGSNDDLNKTSVTQPAVLLTSFLYYEYISELLDIKPELLCGHSLGEYTALLVGGTLRLKDALSLVHNRGLLMETAESGSMYAILNVDINLINDICLKISNETNSIVAPANINSPNQVVISGNAEAVNLVISNLKEQNHKKNIKLNVTVPSHCKLMSEPASEFTKLLDKVSLQLPKYKVIHNINSEIASSIEELKLYLINQLTHPVKWVDTMNYIKQFNGVIIECGPGKVLSGLAKGNNINDNVYSTSSSNFIEEIEKAI
tara:strand:+ start:342 stop:1265 length:924 start_codon:yes stop_codon:yes gene_type:complete